MIYTDLTKKAMKAAVYVLEDKYDKGGMPCIIHTIHVAEQMDDEDSICAALLHEVIKENGITLQGLLLEGFSERTVIALKLLTKRNDVPYDEYIRRIKKNRIARKVKIADLSHDCDLDRLHVINEDVIKTFNKNQETLRYLLSR